MYKLYGYLVDMLIYYAAYNIDDDEQQEIAQA